MSIENLNQNITDTTMVSDRITFSMFLNFGNLNSAFTSRKYRS